MRIFRALVIEDDPDLVTIFGEALRAAGFETETITTGQAALTRLGDVEPDVVVLDLHLPEVDGRQILRRIHADPRLVRTRVIIATADARLAETLSTQTDLVLIKPVSFIQLRDLAKRLQMT